MEKTNHPYAVRLFGNKISIDEQELPSGKKYHLLNLPYYLTGQIEKYLDWFIHTHLGKPNTELE